jgi:hypothetical protein
MLLLLQLMLQGLCGLQSCQVQVQQPLVLVRQSLWCHCCGSQTAMPLVQQRLVLLLLLLLALLLLGAMASLKAACCAAGGSLAAVC